MTEIETFKFKPSPPFEFCGINWVNVAVTHISFGAASHMNVSTARRLRDWLTSILPDEAPAAPADVITLDEHWKPTLNLRFVDRIIETVVINGVSATRRPVKILQQGWEHDQGHITWLDVPLVPGIDR